VRDHQGSPTVKNTTFWIPAAYNDVRSILLVLALFFIFRFTRLSPTI
jgi:hypothetical protein